MRTLSFFLFFSLSCLLHAQADPPSLQECIETLKAANRTKAPPEKFAAYQQILTQIEALGAQLIAVSPELPDKAQITVEKSQLKFTVLSDLNLKVAAEYGLVFELTPEVEKLYAEFFSIKE